LPIAVAANGELTYQYAFQPASDPNDILRGVEDALIRIVTPCGEISGYGILKTGEVGLLVSEQVP
jgi:hypothetical protein